MQGFPQARDRIKRQVFSNSSYCPEDWRLYYDETQNFRSLQASRVIRVNDNGSVSASDSLEDNFTLGGVALVDTTGEEEFREAFRQCRFPTRTDDRSGKQEVKFRTVFGRGASFLRCIEGRHAPAILDLLDRRDTFVHIHSMNAFFYAVTAQMADKLATILGRSDKGIDYRESLPELQDMLYNLVLEDKVWYMQLLLDNGYPDITKASDIRSFCDEVDKFIHNNSENILYGFPQKSDPLSWYQTSRLIRHVAMQCMILGDLDDNRLQLGSGTGWIIDSLVEFYWKPCFLWFPNASHVFDRETVIEERINELFPEGLGNCSFVHSHDDELVQLSDVWVGLYAKFEKYLDEIIFSQLLPNYEINPYNLCVEDSVRQAAAMVIVKKNIIERSLPGLTNTRRRQQERERLANSLAREAEEDIPNSVSLPNFDHAIDQSMMKMSSSLSSQGKCNIRRLARTVIRAREKSPYLIRIEESSQIVDLRFRLLSSIAQMK